MTKPREGEDRPAARSGWAGALSSLENPQFRWLYASNMAFFFAMNGQIIVRSWITFQLTGSPMALGFISFSVAGGMLLFSPLGGAMADRLDRRRIIAAGQATVVLSELTILSLLVAGRLQFWHLLTATALTGCVFPFIMPARQAIVANIVGKGGLTNAMALNMAGMNTTRIVGPAAAGFLIAHVGTETTYAIGVSLYLLGLLCVFGVHRSHPPPHARETSIGKNILDGFRYVRDDRLVLVLLFFGLIPMFLAMPFQTLLVVFAEEVWEVGSNGLGMMSAAAGIGGLVGSLVVAWQSQAQGRLRRMMLSMLGFGSFLLFFSVSPYFLLALPFVLIANIFASIYGTLNNTAIQLIIPDHVRGRISSFLMMSFSFPLLGSLPMSAVAEVYGAPLAVGGASALAVLVSVFFYLGSPALRGMDRSVRAALQPEEPSGSAGTS